MIDFGSSGQSQGGDSQDDPIQKMIQQALAASRGNDAAFQPRAPEGTLPVNFNGDVDRPSFGEKIGAKTPAATPRPVAEQPVRVVTQPRSTITSPGATGVLVPIARESTPSTSFGQKIGAKT